MRPPPAPCIAYGEHPDQVANLHVPADDGPWPCVVLLHGGFWRTGWDRTLMTPLALDLVERGFAAWNVEYRRVGQEGGGWPGTFDDVTAALDALAERPEIARVATCGHSAGGHLALWAAGAHPLPAAAISLAGVCDPGSAARENLGRGAVQALLGGGPDAVPERYAFATPAARVPQLLVHGTDDEDVPLAQSAGYAGRTGAELVTLAGAGHFDVVDPGHAAWAAVVERLPGLLSL